MQNEPNFTERTARGRGPIMRNEPNLPPDRPAGPPLEAIMQNEPNLPSDRPEGTRARSFDRVERAKRTQFPGDPAWDGGRLCKTNPISGAIVRNKANFGPDGRGAPGWGRACETKPILPRGWGRPRAIVQNEANLPPAGRQSRRSDQSCETNPISRQGRVGRGLGDGGRGGTVQTNPIGQENTPPFHYSIVPPSQSDANRAKRSQFAGPPRAGTCRAKRTQSCQPRRGLGDEARGLSCETKPISRHQQCRSNRNYFREKGL
jgi:hypothetical protein